MVTAKKQNFLPTKQKQIFCSSEKWNLVSSLFQSDIASRENLSHIRWLKKNTDRHSIKEILMILEGKSLSSLNGLVYQASPGTIFLFDSYEEHDRLYPPTTKYLTHLWICFLKTRAIVRILHINGGKIDNTRKQELILKDTGICNLFEREWACMKDSNFDADLKRRKMLSLLFLLFTEIIEHGMSGKTDLSGDGKHQDNVIRAINQHISSTSGKAMTVEKLARIAGYSKFHFFRLFKKHSGQNVHDCINATRLKKTEEMLKNGFFRKQISDELGFSCPAAFSNWYARHKNS